MFLLSPSLRLFLFPGFVHPFIYSIFAASVWKAEKRVKPRWFLATIVILCASVLDHVVFVFVAVAVAVEWFRMGTRVHYRASELDGSFRDRKVPEVFGVRTDVGTTNEHGFGRCFSSFGEKKRPPQTTPRETLCCASTKSVAQQRGGRFFSCDAVGFVWRFSPCWKQMVSSIVNFDFKIRKNRIHFLSLDFPQHHHDHHSR